MSSTQPITVMIADDHPIMRDGLRAALETEGGIDVVTQAADGIEAVAAALSARPQVIIMDMIMPHKNGIDACREIIAQIPDTRVLMLTASTDEDAVLEAVAAGATGYMQKLSGPKELADAVRDLAQGRPHLPDDAINKVLAAVRDTGAPTARQVAATLTANEREIVQMFASGKSYAQIAKAKNRSTVTIRNTFYRIQDKLGVATKQEVAVWAARSGLLDDATPNA